DPRQTEVPDQKPEVDVPGRRVAQERERYRRERGADQGAEDDEPTSHSVSVGRRGSSTAAAATHARKRKKGKYQYDVASAATTRTKSRLATPCKANPTIWCIRCAWLE